MRLHALVLLGVAAASVDVPAFLWGDLSAEGAHVDASASQYTRQQLLQTISPLFVPGHVLHFYIFDGMTSDMLAALSSSRKTETAALMQRVGATILKSSSPISAARADLSGEMPLSDDIRQAAGERCDIVSVDATKADRDSYMERSVTPSNKCVVYLLKVTSARSEEDLKFLVSAVSAMQGQSTHTFALLGDPTGVAAVSQPRFLAASAEDSSTPVRVTPEIVVGLLVGFALLFVAIVGLQCTMAIRAPDIMHSVPLPAGKEY